MTSTPGQDSASSDEQARRDRDVEQSLPLRRRARHALRRFARVIAHWFGPPFLRVLSRTWRMRILGEENLAHTVGEGRGYLIALWHGRMLLGLPHHGSREWYVLVSGSQDGDISHALLERFGYRVILGRQATEARARCERC